MISLDIPRPGAVDEFRCILGHWGEAPQLCDHVRFRRPVVFNNWLLFRLLKHGCNRCNTCNKEAIFRWLEHMREQQNGTISTLKNVDFTCNWWLYDRLYWLKGNYGWLWNNPHIGNSTSNQPGLARWTGHCSGDTVPCFKVQKQDLVEELILWWYDGAPQKYKASTRNVKDYEHIWISLVDLRNPEDEGRNISQQKECPYLRCENWGMRRKRPLPTFGDQNSCARVAAEKAQKFLLFL